MSQRRPRSRSEIVIQIIQNTACLYISFIGSVTLWCIKRILKYLGTIVYQIDNVFAYSPSVCQSVCLYCQIKKNNVCVYIPFCYVTTGTGQDFKYTAQMSTRLKQWVRRCRSVACITRWYTILPSCIFVGQLCMSFVH